MKKTTILVAFLGLSASFSFAQKFKLLSSTDEILTIEHTFNELTPQETEINSISHWNFDQTYKITSKKKGAPALPTFAESLIIPNQGAVELVIEHDGYTEYNNVLISPSKGSLKRNVSPSSIPYEFGAEYNEDAFYPGQLATMSEPFNLRNTRGVSIQFSPYQYNPVTKVLRVYKNVQASLVINDLETGLNELLGNHIPNDVFRDVYANQYINAGEVTAKYNPLEEEGEMLIITADQFTDELEPFVEWKNQSGIKTTVVTTNVAGSSDTQIKSYISNFYNSNPNLIFVLLVGDHAQVPSHTYGSSGWEQLWSDSYYAQLTGGSNDYYPEVFVGRFSGTTSQHIQTQVDRTLEYEKTPAAGTWMQNAIGLASDEGAGYGDDGEADWQHARNIRTKLMNYGYTEVYEFYDGSQGGSDANGNPSASIINPAVNSGVGLFNYTGHGDQSTCITGNYGTSNINSATNNGKYPFVISVACNNGTFTSGTCISETWSWATNSGSPTGAIAACGSTILMAWAEPMQTQDEMAELISESYTNNRKATLGGLFYNAQMSVLEEYNNSATAREVMQTWVMFGDPSVLFRNQATMDMNVSHVGNVPLGTTSVVVNCDVDDATVTIVQDGEIIGKSNASGGSATINFAALTSNLPLIVTAVKQNYKPYQGVITVADGPASIAEQLLDQVSIAPNPATDFVQVNWNEALVVESIELLSLSGEIVAVPLLNGTSATIATSELASGMYILQITAGGAKRTSKVVVN